MPTWCCLALAACGAPPEQVGALTLDDASVELVRAADGGSDAERATAADRDAAPAASGLRDGAPEAAARCGLLRAQLRDFKREHPDFEHVVNGWVVPGLVQATLGPDHKPVVNASLAQQNGLTRFDTWYTDIDGLNQSFSVDVPLSPAGNGAYVFDSAAFFPIDERGNGSAGDRPGGRARALDGRGTPGRARPRGGPELREGHLPRRAPHRRVQLSHRDHD